MTLRSISGGFIPIGPRIISAPVTGTSNSILDAANEAMIFIGRMVTSDGLPHTIDTTGPSSIGWQSGSVTFANGATSVSVGLGSVDTGNGPPARASNVADVITSDVKAVFAGGGGGIVAGPAWQTSVPTTGTKLITPGDLVALTMQMTARGGADSIGVSWQNTIAAINRPAVTSFTGAVYSGQAALPLSIITFSDGAFGWIEQSDVLSTGSVRTWNSASATKEYGQLFAMPFPMKVCGIYGSAAIGNDTDVVLYSDPLGTPVAEKTVSIDANVVQAATGRLFFEYFSSPYTTTANQPIGAILKPGAANISAYYKTLASATHRVADPWGVTGYGISRAAGAFADANSSLDHYYIGLIVSALAG